MSSIQQTNQMETCSKCETKIDTEKNDGWDYCACLDAHFCPSCSPTNTCSCEGNGDCDCANCDEEAWGEVELYRHYECCECGKDIEDTGTLYDDKMCLECETKSDDEETNENDNASPKGLKEKLCNTSISSMDAQEEITADTLVKGIMCKKCDSEVPPHSVKRHLDINDPIHKCPHPETEQEKEIALLTEYRAIWEEWNKIDEFYKPNPEYPICVLCKKHLSGTPYGNNPQPIRKKGKCCDRCNNDKVIPARMGGDNPLPYNIFGSFDEQILCRKIQVFTPVRGRTELKYPCIWEAFQADQLEDEVADVIRQFYQKTIVRGVFPIINEHGEITLIDMYSAIQSGQAFIRGIKKGWCPPLKSFKKKD